MAYKTEHLDLENATLNEDGNLVLGEFKVTRNPDSDVLKSGQGVDVHDEIIETKIITEEYIDAALESCDLSSPRWQEWTDVRTQLDLLKLQA